MGIFRRRAEQDTAVHHPATARYETRTDGILTLHCFSAAGHYEPDNLGFGALIGLDEHVVEPGAGFAEHAHRGVEILSWVLEGTLRHQDDAGRTELVEPGSLLRQRTGPGIRHSETNASDTEPLRVVQLTVLSDAGPALCELREPPLHLPGVGLLELVTGKTELELRSAYLHVTRGTFNLTGMFLQAGDSVTLSQTTSLAGSGEALVWTAG